ncbi:MAG: hypothetical protein LQ344_006721 [Seirophora lacunosa]|nr:MAG: hypothetical protein LQ344_006721 [Seirophora lacunosa]
MQSAVVLLALLGLTSAAPRPQQIDTAGVEAAPNPVFFTPPYNVLEETGASNEPVIAPRNRLHKRDGNCAPQPAGSGPVSSPDTPEAFLVNPAYPELAQSAPTPDGYSAAMINGAGSLSASKYMGLRTLKSYDTLGCASLCDQATGCQAFNMYIERDPTLDPNMIDCPNPPSLTNFKCTLWGATVSAAQATNKGQWRDEFHVVIAGSNAYNKATPPSAIACYTGPDALGGAINAPKNALGQDTYMGYKYHPFSQSQGYDPSTCAADCNSQTAYNSRHPAADGSYQSCVFINAYVLSMNGVPQGLYCSMYTQVWAASYATNYGQYRGTDRYTVSRSFSYSLNPANDGSGTCRSIPSSSSSSSVTSTTSSSATSVAPATTTTTSEESSSTSSTMETSTSSTSSTTTSSEPSTSSTTTSSEPSTSSTTTSSESSTSTTTTSSEPSTSSTTITSAAPTTSSSSTTSSSTSTTSTSSTSTSATPSATGFCLQNPSTGEYASLSRNGNGLEFGPKTAKNLPSLYKLDSSSRLVSTVTGLFASLQMPTFGKDGSAAGHVTGTELDRLDRNPNYEPLECDVSGGDLKCRSPANYIDPVKTPATRTQVYSLTEGNNGVDKILFAPASGAVAVKVRPAAECGPNYS